MQANGTISENLRAIYELLNDDKRPTGEIAHSLTIGDLIEVDNCFYRVAPMGFEEVIVA